MGQIIGWFGVQSNSGIMVSLKSPGAVKALGQALRAPR
jgi:hypothetical protein